MVTESDWSKDRLLLAFPASNWTGNVDQPEWRQHLEAEANVH